MLKMSREVLDWICQQIPDAPKNPLGGRPSIDKRKVVAGIFWMLDNGAKWKDLPQRFGSKSAVHRWFKRWMEEGVFEQILRSAGSLVEERDGYRLYECFIDGTFSKAKGGGFCCGRMSSFITSCRCSARTGMSMWTTTRSRR